MSVGLSPLEICLMVNSRSFYKISSTNLAANQFQQGLVRNKLMDGMFGGMEKFGPFWRSTIERGPLGNPIKSTY